MEDFDPDAYLAEKDEIPMDSEGFDPDKYLAEVEPSSKLASGLRGLAQGASFGFADEIAGGVESLFTDKTYEQARDESRSNFKRAKESNPATYMTGEIGGAIGTALIPGVGAAGSLGRMAGTGAALGGLGGLGHSEADNVADMAIDTGTGAVLGGALGAGGYALGKGIQSASNKVSQKYAPAISKMLPVGKKQNSDEIMKAAQALGFEPTPGMLNASESLQKLESSLHQSPTIGGYLARQKTMPAVKGLASATDDIVKDASSLSPFETGELAKKLIGKNVNDKFAPSIEGFKDLAKYTKDIPTSAAGNRRISQNIMKIPEVETFDLPVAKQIVKALEKNPSVDQIKMLRTMLGKKASSAVDGAERSAYWQMYAKLGKLEENSLKRGVIASARTKGEGNKIASQMLDQLKGSKKSYSDEITKLQDFAESSGIRGPNNPDDFIGSIGGIESENVAKKLLPFNDVRQAQALKSNFGDAFEPIRQARVQDLAKGVHVDGEAIPSTLLRNTKNLTPESKSMLFGDKAPKLDALSTVNQALPDKVGPSGTQQAFDVKEMLNPFNQAKDLARYGAYKFGSSEKIQKVAEMLRSSPKFENLAQQNPKAFQALVYQMSQKMKIPESLQKVAGPQEFVPQREAEQQFLEGN